MSVRTNETQCSCHTKVLRGLNSWYLHVFIYQQVIGYQTSGTRQ